jgi:hypothetical protein
MRYSIRLAARNWLRSYRALGKGGRFIGYGVSAAIEGGRRNVVLVTANGGKETSRMVPGGSLATTGHASREILSPMVAEQLPLRGAGRVVVLSPDVH